VLTLESSSGEEEEGRERRRGHVSAFRRHGGRSALLLLLRSALREQRHGAASNYQKHWILLQTHKTSTRKRGYIARVTVDVECTTVLTAGASRIAQGREERRYACRMCVAALFGGRAAERWQARERGLLSRVEDVLAGIVRFVLRSPRFRDALVTCGVRMGAAECGSGGEVRVGE
jgi:hypothetical protein